MPVRLPLTKKLLIFVLIYTVLFCFIFIGFFWYRAWKINKDCYTQLTHDFNSQAWGGGEQLPPDSQQELTRAKNAYLLIGHEQCINDAKFFILF